MTLNFDNFRWDGLLQQPALRHDVVEFAKFHAGKNVLVTGAGGSIGSALAQAIFAVDPRRLVLLDSSEQNLFRVDTQLSESPGSARRVPVLGSVTDELCLRDVFDRNQPEIVYHSAALKHVPLMESEPVRRRAEQRLWHVHAGQRRAGFRANLIMISTDKAVNPHSIMGASKRLAEIVLLALGNDESRMSSIRLGNVLGSEGSVIPLFLDQIARGGPVTVTHPDVERYFLSMEETVSCIFRAAASCPSDTAVCFPDMDDPIKIADLARFLIEQSSAEGIVITYTGLRPGDKLREQFVSEREVVSRELVEGLYWIESSRVTESELREGLAELDAALAELNLAKLLATLTRLVPEYQPSAYLLNQSRSRPPR